MAGHHYWAEQLSELKQSTGLTGNFHQGRAEL